MQAQMLAPAAVLVLWTLIMLFWMAFTRLPAMKCLGGGLKDAKPGGRGQDLDGVIPDKVQWKAHNYNHLHEQPTVFYAVCLLLAMVGWGDGFNAWLAWAYVGLRVAHSLVQATVNAVAVRFALFALSSLVLIALVFHAAIGVFGIHF